MGRQKLISDEDRILWNRIAETTTPIAGKKRKPVAETEAQPVTLEAFVAEALSTDVKSTMPSYQAQPVHRPPASSFDGQTREKLAKGRLNIGATVDLHGLTQSEAYALLLSFVGRAHGAGLRYVLVITGKGASYGSEGALKRAVPAWLSTPPFRAYVSGHNDAARNHGGAGALYLRLRRPKP